MARFSTPLATLVLLFANPIWGQTHFQEFNHGKPILDAHNCYPYEGKWSDRIDRALGAGFPVGIEQDLAWAVDAKTGKGRVVVSHKAETSGTEPTLESYFFERVRPLVERALKENNRQRWPLIVVHFDVKDNRPELHAAVWEILGRYESWITTAPKAANPNELQPLDVKPLLVLTEDNDAQEEAFFHRVPIGGRLRLFGSAHTARIPGESKEAKAHAAATMAPEHLLTETPTNYRRWWNNSWWEVEEGGQQAAGEWTAADSARLKALVDHAHALGYWIRFYTLDGFTQQENHGWDQGYNFGSESSARQRWKATLEAGVDLIATDQYEQLSAAILK